MRAAVEVREEGRVLSGVVRHISYLSFLRDTES
jgi:hypothetical protein